jgi:hypothetical protein
MKRPKLQEIDLDQTMTDLLAGKPMAYMTMDPGQWDGLLNSAYLAGWTLLEIKNETPVKAYRRGLDS